MRKQVLTDHQEGKTDNRKKSAEEPDFLNKKTYTLNMFMELKIKMNKLGIKNPENYVK